NLLTIPNLATTNGSVGFFNSNLQFMGNQGNILPWAEVGGGAGTGDFATYTTVGATNSIAPFSNYWLQPVSTTPVTLANSGVGTTGFDIVKLTASGTAAAITGPGNAIGALLINQTLGTAITLTSGFS